MLVPVAAAVLTLLGGCFGVSQNPSYFPYLLPTEDVIRTHAKPIGPGYYANFDPHACRIEVRPLEATNPVQTRHVLIATVYDDKGQPRRNRRVEWLLEGAGNIVEVDESGYFPGRGYKVDNHYAVSYTDYCEHLITRGNCNPNDDFVIRPGQSWCVITSAVEGDTHVTAYAPEIFDWDRNRVVVTKHWIDAEWSVPQPAANRTGTVHVFTTNVFRHTDHQPLANYRVRYRILDGPPAVFLPMRTQEAVAISDLSGNANITLAQVSPQPGVNRVAIDIIRPPDPTSPSGAGIVIGRAETAKEWLAPSVALTKTGPANVAVGQELTYSLSVSNSGRVESQAQTLRDVVPEGLQYVRSEPPAAVDGNHLTWTLGTLPPGQAHTIQATFRATRVGTVTNCAAVTTLEGLRAEGCATTQITTPQLNVTMTGPPTAVIGLPVTLSITVTNPGSGPATNVVLSDQFDAGLEHESRANPVELRLGTLGAGENRTIPIVLTPRIAGRLANHVTATADGGLRAQAEHVLETQAARLTITKTGPAMRYVDRPAVFDIRVVNQGDVPVSNVVVRDLLPPELAFASASDGGQSAGNQVVWTLGTLPAREQKAIQLTARCLTITPRTVNIATATADPGLQVSAEAALEIRGAPAFKLEVGDTVDPVQVGGRTTYRIAVTNQGSLPGQGVVVIATVPAEMRIVNTNGPTQARVEGQQITFPEVNDVRPQQVLSYTVDVDALRPGDPRLNGDVRFRVELRASTLTEPVVETESTHIFTPVPGAGTFVPQTPVPTPGAPASPPAAVPPQTAPPPAASPPANPPAAPPQAQPPPAGQASPTSGLPAAPLPKGPPGT